MNKIVLNIPPSIDLKQFDVLVYLATKMYEELQKDIANA